MTCSDKKKDKKCKKYLKIVKLVFTKVVDISLCVFGEVVINSFSVYCIMGN